MEVAIAREVAGLLMFTDARPVIAGLQRQIHIFRRFQFQDGETPGAGYSQEVKDSTLPSGLREDPVHINDPGQD